MENIILSKDRFTEDELTTVVNPFIRLTSYFGQ